jgi:AcrR family transcriptional regulator
MVPIAGGDEPGPAPGDELEARISAAALACLGRAGLGGTTLDDIAAEAGCSRATIYRTFPGGRDVLLAAVLDREINRLTADLSAELASAGDLADALVTTIGGTAMALRRHAALQYLMVHEPGAGLPHLSFDGLDPVLERAVDFLAPLLERHTDARTAREAAEWAARLVVLYAGDIDAPIDLTDPADTDRLVSTYVLPGLVAPHR